MKPLYLFLLLLVGGCGKKTNTISANEIFNSTIYSFGDFDFDNKLVAYVMIKSFQDKESGLPVKVLTFTESALEYIWIDTSKYTVSSSTQNKIFGDEGILFDRRKKMKERK